MDPVLEEFLSDPAADVSALHDVARIKIILEQCARDGRAISYSELLLNLGFRFTRPKMRAVCKTLDKIDQITTAEGRPALAVLVVQRRMPVMARVFRRVSPPSMASRFMPAP